MKVTAVSGFIIKQVIKNTIIIDQPPSQSIKPLVCVSQFICVQLLAIIQGSELDNRL